MSFAIVYEDKINANRDDGKASTFAKSSPNHHTNNLTRHSRDSFLNSQQMIGNSAVENRVRYNTGFDFSTMDNRLQPKLKVSEPGDANEQEADAIAEQIMKMSVPHSIDPMTTRKEKKKFEVGRKPSTIDSHATRDESTSKIKDILAGSGSIASSSSISLDDNTRGFMESRFGFDFSKVRIHTGEIAERSAQSIDALAYTIGNDIVFRKEQYVPETSRGRLLLAHELAHVLQQGEKLDTIMRFPSASKLDNTDLFTSMPQPTIFRTSSGISVTLFFGQNSFLLGGTNYKMAEKLSEDLRYMVDPLIVVDGHASSEGSEEKNLGLSELRRTAAIAILKSKLVGTANIQGTAYGETKPAVEEPAENEKERNSKRALNRRVEITIIPRLAPSTQATPTKPIDLSLPRPSMHAETPEERLEKMLKEPAPQLIPKQSFSDVFWKKFDDSLDSVLRDVKVPAKYRGFIKGQARSALEKGAEEVLDRALDQVGISGNEKEAIKNILKAASQTKL